MTGITDEMVERAAKAMGEVTYIFHTTGAPGPKAKECARAALLAALGESHVVAPREPTIKQLEVLDDTCFLATEEELLEVYRELVAAVSSPDRGGAPSPELPIISD